MTLGIESNLPQEELGPRRPGADHAVFYIPAVGKGDMLCVVRIREGPFAGVLIRPIMQENSVKIDVSALVKTRKKLSELLRLPSSRRARSSRTGTASAGLVRYRSRYGLK